MEKGQLYDEFFGQFKREYASKQGFTIATNSNGKNYLRIGAPASPANSGYHVGFTDGRRDGTGVDRFRVEVTFSSDYDKSAFDELKSFQKEIEDQIGQSLDWHRMDGTSQLKSNIRSQVSLYYPEPASIKDADYLKTNYLHWAVANAARFRSVLDQYLTNGKMGARK